MNSKAEMWVEIWYLDETDPTILNTKLGEALKQASFTIVGEKDHHFSPQGYTKTFLLSESHCALHTWPEINRTWLELASCNKEKLLRFSENMKEVFGVEKVAYVETK